MTALLFLDDSNTQHIFMLSMGERYDLKDRHVATYTKIHEYPYESLILVQKGDLSLDSFQSRTGFLASAGTISEY